MIITTIVTMSMTMITITIMTIPMIVTMTKKTPRRLRPILLRNRPRRGRT